MQQNLFKSETIEQFFDRNRMMLERDVSNLNSVEELDRESDKISGRYLIDTAVLVREEAVFTPKESRKGVDVELEIPFTGNARLFSVSLPGSLINVSGEVHDERGYSTQDPATYLKFTKTFDAAGSDEVRAWAKGLADAIERQLSSMAPRIQEFNEQITTGAKQLLGKRRKVLVAAEDLKSNLGKGI